MFKNMISAVRGAVKTVAGVAKRVVGAVAAVGAVMLLGAAQAQAQYNIVSSDASGNISFTPSGLVQPIIVGVIACITGATSLVLIWIGVKWLYRVVKGAK